MEKLKTFTTYLLLTIFALLLSILITKVAYAETTTISVSVPCNNLNWEYSPRCTAPPKTFEFTENGWKGTLESGVEFKQSYITPNIMLFTMEQVKWLTYQDKVIYID